MFVKISCINFNRSCYNVRPGSFILRILQFFWYICWPTPWTRLFHHFEKIRFFTDILPNYLDIQNIHGGTVALRMLLYFDCQSVRVLDGRIVAHLAMSGAFQMLLLIIIWVVFLMGDGLVVTANLVVSGAYFILILYLPKKKYRDFLRCHHSSSISRCLMTKKT